jgi:Protein of unknown function (DUF2891)
MLAHLLETRVDIARALAQPIRLGVARRDTGHPAFHGCLDWHSAVHGVWALTAYARMTGDPQDEPRIAEILNPAKIAAEQAFLRSRPDFEMPYGRAWFLRLAREHELHFRTGALRPMAEELHASLMAHYGAHPPDPRRGSYQSASWALLNMHDYAAWSGDAAALDAIRRWVETHFLDVAQGCDCALEAGHFMAVTTNWAWLVSKILPQDQFDPWAEAFFARSGLPHPVTHPLSWHHHGLNFSRAWGLAALHAASTSASAKEAYLDAHIAHFRATYDTPALWRGSYEGVGHWVPQFGMLALQPLFERLPPAASRERGAGRLVKTARSARSSTGLPASPYPPARPSNRWP